MGRAENLPADTSEDPLSGRTRRDNRPGSVTPQPAARSLQLRVPLQPPCRTHLCKIAQCPAPANVTSRLQATTRWSHFLGCRSDYGVTPKSAWPDAKAGARFCADRRRDGTAQCPCADDSHSTNAPGHRTPQDEPYRVQAITKQEQGLTAAIPGTKTGLTVASEAGAGRESARHRPRGRLPLCRLGLPEHLGCERLQGRARLPRIRRQPGFAASLLKKGDAVPLVFDRDLGKKQSATTCQSHD
jgi:hypothetical protein